MPNGQMGVPKLGLDRLILMLSQLSCYNISSLLHNKLTITSIKGTTSCDARDNGLEIGFSLMHKHKVHRCKHQLYARLYDSQKALIVLSQCPLHRPIIATSSPPPYWQCWHCPSGPEPPLTALPVKLASHTHTRTHSHIHTNVRFCWRS